MKTLDNWSVNLSDSDPYLAPELRSQLLCGVSGLEKTKGHVTITSRIVGKRNGSVVTYSGSEYKLLNVNPEYENLYPDAKNRLMNSLKEV